jgi:hypothetical protein
MPEDLASLRHAANGTGVDDVVAGVDVIVHCANASKRDVEARRELVKAATAQRRPPYLVYFSVVGVNGIPFIGPLIGASWSCRC